MTDAEGQVLIQTYRVSGVFCAGQVGCWGVCCQQRGGQSLHGSWFGVLSATAEHLNML